MKIFLFLLTFVSKSGIMKLYSCRRMSRGRTYKGMQTGGTHFAASA